MKFAFVLDGAIKEYRDYPETPACKQIDGLPVLRPVQEVFDPFDPNTQKNVLVEEIYDTHVTHHWTSVALTPEEAAEYRANKQRALKEQRALAYVQESDPLFFKAQRGEATMEEWLAKVAEIKARYS